MFDISMIVPSSILSRPLEPERGLSREMTLRNRSIRLRVTGQPRTAMILTFTQAQTRTRGGLGGYAI